MDDKPKSDLPATTGATQDLENSKRKYRDYSEEDKYSVLAAYDIYGGNIYRTAIAYNLPESTVRNWVRERAARGGGPSNLERERRGHLAQKLESKVHDVIESVTPEVIAKATLAQRGVFMGISLTHLHNMRRPEPDPQVELAEALRLINLKPSQLPPTLLLEPGEEIPEGIIDMQSSPENPDSYAPAESAGPETEMMKSEHDPDCLGFIDVLDQTLRSCSCGFNQQSAKDDPDETVN